MDKFTVDDKYAFELIEWLKSKNLSPLESIGVLALTVYKLRIDGDLEGAADEFAETMKSLKPVSVQ